MRDNIEVYLSYCASVVTVANQAKKVMSVRTFVKAFGQSANNQAVLMQDLEMLGIIDTKELAEAATAKWRN